MTATYPAATAAPSDGAAAAVTRADANPLVARVSRFAAESLRPAALETDRTEVGEQVLHRLGELGALNHLAPAEYGGAALDRAADRRLHEVLAAACFNTWLIWTQHATLVGLISAAVEAGAPRSELAERALRGEVLLGAGISDVRRFPGGSLTARPDGAGWVFDGTISWVSGWGLHGALAVAAVEPETRTMVLALVPVGAGLTATPLPLSVVSGSRTERVTVREVRVSPEHVLSVEPLEAWRARDRSTAADARAHHFGLASAVLDELGAEAHPGAREVAASWAPRVARLREKAYAWADAAAAATSPEPLLLEQRLRAKVASGETLATLTRALVVARSGRALGGDDTAQLYARAALFVLVQGQTDAVRRTQLSTLAENLVELPEPGHA